MQKFRVRDVRRLILGFLGRYGFRDPPPSAEAWNAQYSSGRWDYLAQLPELSRFSVVVGYLRHFRPGGSILDVGCGEGFLLQKLLPHDYSHYVGVDLSSAATDKGTALRVPRTTFSAADAQVYVPTEKFDAIVFAEVVYYFADPSRTVERYARALNKGGILLLSTNTAFRGGMAILQELKQHYSTLDETRLTHGDNEWSWVLTVFAGTK